ncbi:MAG: cell division FtsA domain-containing protein [Selenomonadaceae bacterium]|nr:cell division FtsA domain-containing protein [Selenomonadaceae bacterium]
MKKKETAPAVETEIATEEIEATAPAPKKKAGRPRKTQEAAPAEAAPAEKKTSGTKAKATRTKTTAKVTKTPRAKTVKAPKPQKIKINGETIFALDIGTRSVIGIVAEKNGDDIRIVATERMEHKTRAMLDGQIHDVLQVASVIKDVKSNLEKQVGPLSRAAVAAAGRALYTMTAEAEMEVGGIITAEQERSLDFSAVQLAQAKLASSDTIDDPTSYYCVGYSAIQYTLDDFPLKSLIGQRGRIAKASVIATFLPRQVIDSMQSALRESKLEMQAITLEPIAAINVLIPPTMRHLNLVLVDIGAGTSDVAITKNGSVIAYGMVPFAGDEITEAISQRFLLDFNVAERIKREAAAGLDCQFSDILGMPYSMKADEILEPIMPTIKNLAMAISRQIMELNGSEPQAVLLVGGGSLSPRLAQLVTDELKLPAGRVAVRRPELIDGITEIPEILHSPDAVTPLGILKIASFDNIHFMRVFVNGGEYRLFNFRNLTISDALLNAGIRLKDFNGKPGLGIMLNIDGRSQFIPGTMGTLARLTLNGEDANLDTPIENDSRIEITPGNDGTIPQLTLGDVYELPPGSIIYLNGEERQLPAIITVNGEVSDSSTPIHDGDTIAEKKLRTVGETLLACGLSPTGTKISYTLNESAGQYNVSPIILLDDKPTTLSTVISDGDRLEYLSPGEPHLSDILHLTERETTITIYFNDAEHKIPSSAVTIEVNGRPAGPNTIINDGSEITYRRDERKATMVSEALVAVGYEPPAADAGVTVAISVNGAPAQFTDPVKNGDTLTVDIYPHGEDGRPQAPLTDVASKAISLSSISTELDKKIAAELEKEAAAEPPAPKAAAEEAVPKDDAANTGRDGLLGLLLGTEAVEEKTKAPAGRDGLLSSLIIEPKPVEEKPQPAPEPEAAPEPAPAKEDAAEAAAPTPTPTSTPEPVQAPAPAPAPTSSGSGLISGMIRKTPKFLSRRR